MRKHLPRGRRPESRIGLRVNRSNQFRNRSRPGFQFADQLLFPQMPMRDVLAQLRSSVPNRFTVTAIDALQLRKVCQQAGERRLIRTHCSARRCDHDRSFAEHHITGEERSFAAVVKDQMIERMAGRVDCEQFDIPDTQRLTIAKRSVVPYL